MYEETIPIISVSHTNDGSRKLNYGSNDSNNNKDSALSDANSTKKSNIPSSTMVRPHKNTSSKQRQQPHLSQNQTNIRFMVMLFTGITFFICILFVFTQSAISILHDRHSHTGNYKQYRVDGILPDSRNIAIERSPSLSFYCDDNASSSCTFRQLGQIMVPSAYQNMIDTMQRHLFTSSSRNETNTNSHVSGGIDTNTITAAATTATITMSICTTCLQPPSNVNNIRKQILLVRDLLDIFSPIYSNTTKATQQLRNRRMEAATVDDNENDDPWAVVRKELDIGYTLIGKYQDLDHSHVRYTVEEISILQYKILQWYNQFTTSIRIKHDTTSSPSTIQYLSLMNDTITTSTTPTWYTHTAESRLFWKGLQHEFHQAQHDNYKSQRHQLQHKQQQTSSIDTSAITILQLLFIKQVQLAKKYYMKAYQHVSVLDNDFEQIDYHNLRKVLRCIVDEYNIFFTSTSSRSKSNGSMILLDASTLNLSMEDIRTFDTARQMLGDLNDNWNAYKYYMDHHHQLHKEHLSQHGENDVYPLIQSINTKWNAFKSWSTDTADLNGVLTRLLEQL